MFSLAPIEIIVFHLELFRAYQNLRVDITEENEDAGKVESEMDLQSLPVDALEIIVAELDRQQVTAISRQSRSLREAALSILRGSLRRLLDRSAHELCMLRNKALTMREQSLAGREYRSLSLLITTARLVRMELRILASASWRYLCAPSGPGLALPGALLDRIEAVLNEVASGEITRGSQPEATATLFMRCEKFLDFFSDALEPRLGLASVGWAPMGSRLADTLAATHSRHVHKEAITRTEQGVRLFASYRLPGLVEAPPTLPRSSRSLHEPSGAAPTDRTAAVAGAQRILLYLRRSVHMHNLVLVLKDQWAMDDTLERRGSTALLSGFIFDNHDQPKECQFSQSEARPVIPQCVLKASKNPTARSKWDGLLCELQMLAPSIHLLPPHLQHLAGQIWPNSSTDTFYTQASCPSLKTTLSTPANPSSSSRSLALRQPVNTTSKEGTDLSRKSTRITHSLMAVNNRYGDANNLQKSLSFDNFDAVKEVLRRVSRQDAVGKPECSAPSKEIKTVDLSVVGNSCVCFAFSDFTDFDDEITNVAISDKPRQSVLSNGKEKNIEESVNKVSPLSQNIIDEGYYFRLQITARYPEPSKSKSGLREATITVVDSEDGPSAWLVDDVPLC